MYKNLDHKVPIVANSRFAGHGFTEEDIKSNPQADDTVKTHKVFGYEDINTAGYVYPGDNNEYDRLLTPSETNNHLYYTTEPSTSFSKLNNIYRKSLGFSVPYQNVDTSYNEDSKQSDTFISETFWDNCCYYSKKAFSKCYEYLCHFFVLLKVILIKALVSLISMVAVLFILNLIYTKLYGNDLNTFKEKPGKKETPPSLPKEVVREPTKPEFSYEPVHFKDILGIEEAKEDVMEVVKFIKHPYLYKKVGAKVPKGILLVGAPGTGKTMLAKAVATEAGIPFIYASGPEFIEIYVGQGAQRIRALFQRARKIAPCIIFIDEIDAVGSKRASGSFTGQNREHDQTLNQLLVEMDGFNVSTGITILAATNRMNTLDKALLRPGRFDRVVHIPLPSIKGREDILNHYLKGVNYDKENINVKDLAKITPGYSGADLKNLINEAALITVKQDRQMVTLNDLYEARDKIIMGNKRNLLMPELERKMTAYHEAGHALVAYHLYPDTDPIYKATIITRGSALGFVEQLPDDDFDKSSYKFKEMKSRLAVFMAGRIAEKLVFGFENVTSGASSDIVSATDLAYKMVTQYGMSNKLGSLNFHNLNNMNSKLSSELNSQIEKEIIKLIKGAERLAESILRINRSQLELLASELLKYETLSGEQITTLLKTNKPLKLSEKQFNELNNNNKDNNNTDNTNRGNNNNKTNNNKQVINIDLKNNKHSNLKSKRNYKTTNNNKHSRKNNIVDDKDTHNKKDNNHNNYVNYDDKNNEENKEKENKDKKEDSKHRDNKNNTTNRTDEDDNPNSGSSN